MALEAGDREGNLGAGCSANEAIGITEANLYFQQVVPSHVFLVSLEEEPTVLDRLPSVTCADPDVCSLLQRSGESGTRRSTWVRSEHTFFMAVILTKLTQFLGDSQLSLPWLLPLFPLSSSPVVTKSLPSQRFLSSSTLRSSLVPLLPALPLLSDS